MNNRAEIWAVVLIFAAWFISTVGPVLLGVALLVWLLGGVS